ncbi:MAG: SH3 domain-containing protein [Cellvibrionaceae bacterium]|nr:SH3 domain-containing protein [Cellvibrionaceae bacterium]
MRQNKLFILFFVLVSSMSLAKDKAILRLQVIDPYADVHSGPGRGYPVLHAIEEGEYIDVLTRRPGWYEVRTQNGRVGWVTAAKISRTIQVSGEPADLPDVSFGDYLKNTWRVGYSAGVFSSGELDGSDLWSAFVGYRATSWLGVEAEYGKAYREDVRGDYYGVNVLVEPISKWRLSPYLLLGLGNIKIDSQPGFVPLPLNSSSDYQNYAIGTNFYLGRNFLIKLEYRSYIVSTDTDDAGLGSWRLGFNTFF